MPDDWSSWLWNTALDGAFSAVVGGLFTLLVLYLGLRHERKRSDLQLIQDQAQAALAETIAVASMMAHVGVGRGGTNDLAVKVSLAWGPSLSVLAGQAKRRSLPELAKVLGALADKGRENLPAGRRRRARSFDALIHTLGTAVGVLTNVTTDARHYESAPTSEVAEVLAAIAESRDVRMAPAG